ncbi:MAG: OmpA family protein [Myxococcales bacterium]|nr:OmpA family protein [Myxococcales bacterium]
MARKKKPPEHVNHERWLISYADFITLLFAFFVVMFSVSQVDSNKVGKFSEAFSEAVGIHNRGASGMFEGRGRLAVDAPGRKVEGPAEGAKGAHFPKALVDLETRLSDVLQALRPTKAAAEQRAGATPPSVAPVFTVLRRRTELVLRLDLDLLFDSGSDVARRDALSVLDVIGEELHVREVNVRIEGHTDDVPIHTPTLPSNWHLSTARATAVLMYFAERSNIPPTRLSAAGYGEFQPVADNRTPEGRAKNRRVDIVVSAPPDLGNGAAAEPAPSPSQQVVP